VIAGCPTPASAHDLQSLARATMYEWSSWTRRRIGLSLISPPTWIETTIDGVIAVTALRVGDEDLADIGLEPVAVDETVEHYRCGHAGDANTCDQRSRLAMTIRVAHPQPLAPPAAAVPVRHLVALQVSSMKTSRSGSRSSWPSNQASGWLRTPGRSCSTACPVFFERDAVSGEEAAQRRDRHRHTRLA
jgi:hypothetical protein